VEKGKWNVCPYLELPVSPVMFEYCFPKKLRKNIRAVSRELSRSGGFRIEIAEKGQLNLSFLNCSGFTKRDGQANTSMGYLMARC
jgi:hypothetical protein